MLKSILDPNIGTAGQASGMEKLSTCVIKTQVAEMVNGVVRAINQEMRHAEKPIRRVAKESESCTNWCLLRKPQRSSSNTQAKG